MIRLSKTSWLGASAMLFAVLLLLVAIPYGITSPSNVQKIVLSPTFWPTIIAWGLLLLGLLLFLQSFFQTNRNVDAAETDPAPKSPIDEACSAYAWLRLIASVGLMIIFYMIVEKVGMVWASAGLFAAFSVIVRSPRPTATVLIAVILPLLLYGFFNHIAGVAIPQGDFVRLP